MLQLNSYPIALVISCIVGFMAAGICASFSKNKKNWFIASTILLATIAVASIYLLLSNSVLVIFGLIRIYPFSSLFIALFAVTMLLVNILSYAYSKDYLNLLLLLSLSFAGAFIVA